MELNLPRADTLSPASTAVVRQWLLIEPQPEADARALLEGLRENSGSRIPHDCDLPG